jgi:hypothetical protein
VGYSDSAAYLVSGRNLARGLGLGYHFPDGRFITLTHYPPLYPLVFALFENLGLDLVYAGQALNLLALLGAIILLALLFKYFAKHAWLGLIAAGLFISLPATLAVYTSLMTDGPFATLLLLCLFSVLRYWQSRRAAWLWSAVLATAALPLLRYVGIAMLGVMPLLLGLLLRGPLRERLRRAGAFALAVLAPVAIWFLWVFLDEASFGGRRLTMDGLGLYLQEFRGRFIDTLWSWLPFTSAPYVPGYAARQLIVLAGFLAAIYLVWHLSRNREEASHSIDGRTALFSGAVLAALAHAGSMLAAYLIIVPQPDLTERTLLPLFVFGVILLLVLVDLYSAAWPRWQPALAALAVAGAMVFLAAFARPSWYQVQSLHGGSFGFFTVRWRHSELIAELADLPANQLLVADRAAALLYWADKPAYDLLISLDPDFLSTDQLYGSDPSRLAQRAIREQGAWLIVFDDFEDLVWRSWQVEFQRSDLLAGMDIIGDYSDATIYSTP